MTKIYTEVNYEWDGEKLVEVSSKSFDYDGEIAEMKGGGGTVTQKTEPWDEAKPYYENMYKTASDLAGGERQFYSGQTLANIDPYQREGRDMQASFAKNVANPTMMLGTQRVQDVLAGKYLDPTSNPYLSNAVQGAVGDVFTKYNEQIAPQIRGAAIQAGGMGGSRQGVAEAIAARDATNKAANMAQSMYMQNYGSQMGNLMNMIQQTPSYLQGAMMPGQALEKVGMSNQAYAQDVLNAAQADWQQREDAPWGQIQNLAATLQGGQFRNSISPGLRSNPLATMGGLGLMAGGLLNKGG